LQSQHITSQKTQKEKEEKWLKRKNRTSQKKKSCQNRQPHHLAVAFFCFIIPLHRHSPPPLARDAPKMVTLGISRWKKCPESRSSPPRVHWVVVQVALEKKSVFWITEKRKRKVKKRKEKPIIAPEPCSGQKKINRKKKSPKDWVSIGNPRTRTKKRQVLVYSLSSFVASPSGGMGP
jgi:hypothetical protein